MNHIMLTLRKNCAAFVTLVTLMFLAIAGPAAKAQTCSSSGLNGNLVCTPNNFCPTTSQCAAKQTCSGSLVDNCCGGCTCPSSAPIQCGTGCFASITCTGTGAVQQCNSVNSGLQCVCGTGYTGTPPNCVSTAPVPVYLNQASPLTNNNIGYINVSGDISSNGNFRLTNAISGSGDLYIPSTGTFNQGKAIRVDGSGVTTLNIGNWGDGATGINTVIYGGLGIGANSGSYKLNISDSSASQTAANFTAQNISVADTGNAVGNDANLGLNVTVSKQNNAGNYYGAGGYFNVRNSNQTAGSSSGGYGVQSIVSGHDNNYGLYGEVSGSTGNKYGVYGNVYGQGSGTAVGIRGSVTATMPTIYGIYGSAIGTSNTNTSYGGYFAAASNYGTNYGLYVNGQSSYGTYYSAAFMNGRFGINDDRPDAMLKLKPLFSTEGLRIVSSNYSPLVIRNSGDTVDFFRVDQLGKITINDGTQGMGKVLTSDANGLASWQTPATGGVCANMRKFVGTTSTGGPYNGDRRGYRSADAICDSAFGTVVGQSRSFVCTAEEILGSYKCNEVTSGQPIQSASGNAWINAGPPGYSAFSNDCYGWTSASSSGGYFGRVWAFNSATYGVATVATCDNTYQFACCR